MKAQLLRIAMAAAWSGRAVDRRRAAMLAVAAAVVTVVACGCVSALFMSTRIDTRATAREFSPVGPGAPLALERAALYDETEDREQIYVYWWRVVDPNARIPGIEPNPPVGSWFVSPALFERMLDEPVLAERYRGALRIGPEGVAHRDELLAYRFVEPGVALPEKLSLRPRLAGIGYGSEVLDPFPISVAALALIGIPGLGLLVAAMAQFAPELERRLAVLGALGASARTQRSVLFVHTAVCAAPGAVAAALGWFVISPHLTEVPLVGRRVFASDLGLPVVVTAAIGVGVVVLAMVVAVIRPVRIAGNRPVDYIPQPVTVVRLLPLLAGLAVMLAGTIVPGRSGAKFFFAGVVASAVGAVVGLPFMIDRVGAALAGRPETLSLLVGRRLRRNAVSSASSLLAVGVLAALIPVLAAWVSVRRSLDTPSDTAAYAVELHGDISARERDALAERTDAVPIEVTFKIHASGRETFQLVGNCELLAGPFAPSRCGNTGFVFAQQTGVTLGHYGTLRGYRTRPAGAKLQSTLFLSSDGAAVEDVLRSFVVNGAWPGRQITAPSRQVFHESPLVAWILGAAALAAVVGGLALALHLVAQSARLAVFRSRLLALGTDVSVVRRLAGGEAAVAVALVGLGGTAIGMVSSWMFVQIDGLAAVPYRVIALVVVATLTAAGLAGIAASASISDKPRPIGEFSH